MLKGRNESCGHVIFCSPRAEVRRNVHRPQWSGEAALRKTSWTGTLTDLQYFATVSPQFRSQTGEGVSFQVVFVLLVSLWDSHDAA